VAFVSTRIEDFFMSKSKSLLSLAIVVAMACQPPIASAADAGSLWSWGRNDSGQLGIGTSGDDTNCNVPQEIKLLGSGVTAVATGSSHSLVIQNGTLYAFGGYSGGKLGIGQIEPYTSYFPAPQVVTFATNDSEVKAIAAGANFSMAIVGESRTLYAWGDNSFGQVGIGTSGYGTGPYVPMEVKPAADGTAMTNVTAIAAGYNHSLAIVGGALYAWGQNDVGQLGNKTTTNSAVPTAVTNMGSGVTMVAAGNYFSLAIKDDVLYAWGQNTYGQLGNGTTASYSNTPVEVKNIGPGVQAVAAGNNAVLAVDAAGSVWAWGEQFDATPAPIFTDTLTNIVDVAITSTAAGDAGTIYTYYALDKEGDLYAWGGNAYGELGQGLATDFIYDYYQEWYDGEWYDTYDIIGVNVVTTEPARIGTGFTAISVGMDGTVLAIKGMPVPEPATLGVLALGCVAMMFHRRK